MKPLRIELNVLLGEVARGPSQTLAVSRPSGPNYNAHDSDYRGQMTFTSSL
jgi:hypothetical protein